MRRSKPDPDRKARVNPYPRPRVEVRRVRGGLELRIDGTQASVYRPAAGSPASSGGRWPRPSSCLPPGRPTESSCSDSRPVVSAAPSGPWIRKPRSSGWSATGRSCGSPAAISTSAAAPRAGRRRRLEYLRSEPASLRPDRGGPLRRPVAQRAQSPTGCSAMATGSYEAAPARRVRRREHHPGDAASFVLCARSEAASYPWTFAGTGPHHGPVSRSARAPRPPEGF